MKRIIIFFLIAINTLFICACRTQPLDRYKYKYHLNINEAKYTIVQEYEFPAFMDSMELLIVQAEDQANSVFDKTYMDEGVSNKAKSAILYIDTAYSNRYKENYFGLVEESDYLSKTYESDDVGNSYLTVLYQKSKDLYFFIIIE